MCLASSMQGDERASHRVIRGGQTDKPCRDRAGTRSSIPSKLLAGCVHSAIITMSGDGAPEGDAVAYNWAHSRCFKRRATGNPTTLATSSYATLAPLRRGGGSSHVVQPPKDGDLLDRGVLVSRLVPSPLYPQGTPMFDAGLLHNTTAPKRLRNDQSP
jgi:hypothetical protein